MNERIKLFAELAKNAIPAHLGSRVPSEFTEKFAELIVRECADLVDRAISDGGVDGRVVKEHFGVEE